MANFQQSETALIESATLINIFAEKFGVRLSLLWGTVIMVSTLLILPPWSIFHAPPFHIIYA